MKKVCIMNNEKEKLKNVVLLSCFMIMVLVLFMVGEKLSVQHIDDYFNRAQCLNGCSYSGLNSQSDVE